MVSVRLLSGFAGVCLSALCGSAHAGAASAAGELTLGLHVSQSLGGTGVGSVTAPSAGNVKNTHSPGGAASGGLTYVHNDDIIGHLSTDDWTYKFDATANSTDGTEFGKSHLDGTEIATLTWDGITSAAVTIGGTFKWGPNSASPSSASEFNNARTIGQLGICLNDHAPQAMEGFATGPCGYVENGIVHPGTFIGLGGVGGFGGREENLALGSDPTGSISMSADIAPYLSQYHTMVVYSDVTGIFSEASVTPIPEPGVWWMLIVGFFGAGSIMRRSRGGARAHSAVRLLRR